MQIELCNNRSSIEEIYSALTNQLYYQINEDNFQDKSNHDFDVSFC